MKSKYTLLTICTIFLGSLAQAQIKKGTILPGGSLQYRTDKYENEVSGPQQNIKYIGIIPSVGLAIKDNLVLGVDLGYTSGKNEGYYDIKETNVSGNLFLRKYWNISSKFFAFAHADAGYGRGTVTIDYSEPGTKISKAKSWNISASLVPGIAYSVSRKVQLESSFFPLVSINYTNKNTENFNTAPPFNNTKREDFSIVGSLGNLQQFTFGIRLLL